MKLLPADVASLAVALSGVLGLVLVLRRARAGRPFLPPLEAPFRPAPQRLLLLLAAAVFLVHQAGGLIVHNYGGLGDAAGIAIPLVAAAGAHAVALAVLPRGSAAWRVGMGLLHLWAALPLVYGTFLVARWIGLPEQKAVIEIRERAEGWRALALFAAVVAPVGEEVCFRGLLYPALRARLPLREAVLFSSLAFACVHPLSVWLPMAILGATFAWLVERTGSVLPCIAAHMAFNAFNVSMLLLV